MEFMNSSLENLVKSLTDNNFEYLTEEFGSKNLELLKQKDVYPYVSVKSSKRFNDKKNVSKKADDNGKKTDGHISFFKKDVLLLADVFKKFIDTCLKFYRLDPCHYFSSPGLIWDAMLKVIVRW